MFEMIVDYFIQCCYKSLKMSFKITPHSILNSRKFFAGT